MNEFISDSLFFGMLISLGAYCLGLLLKKRFRLAILNPLLISVTVVITLLALSGVDYTEYNHSAEYLSRLLTPATVCLAIPLYQQTKLLKQSFKAIISGAASGVLTSLCTILGLSAAFSFTHEEYVTFLPKSITTAIGISVSEELGGYASVTAAVIIITGITGSIASGAVFRLFKIDDPIARGVALGSSAHAIGTAKALELGELEGAVSSLSIVVSGIITVVGASVFEKLY